METKFTKGKWVIDDFKGIYVDETDWQICDTDCANGTPNELEQLANAKLIAAAPEMFEMLKEIYDDFETFSNLFSSQKEKIKELLTKITQ